jgi:hypothetical protein
MGAVFSMIQPLARMNTIAAIAPEEGRYTGPTY